MRELFQGFARSSAAAPLSKRPVDRCLSRGLPVIFQVRLPWFINFLLHFHKALVCGVSSRGLSPLWV